MLIPLSPDELTAEIRKASRSLKRCPCGSAVVMHYDPGCTFIHCIGERSHKMAIHDWNPTDLADQWNSQPTLKQ